MRAWIRPIFACFVALAGVAVLAFWGRSYLVADVVGGDGHSHVRLTSAAGSVIVSIARTESASPGPTQWTYATHSAPRQLLLDTQLGDAPWNRLGFGVTRQNRSDLHPGSVTNVLVPHWAAFLLATPWLLALALRNRPAAGDPYRHGVLECPCCGQLLAHVPPECPVCDQCLLAPQTH